MSLRSSLILTSHLILGFPNGFRFSNQNFVRISYLRYACYMLRPCHLPSFYDPNSIWWRAQTVNLLIMHIPTVSTHICPIQLQSSFFLDILDVIFKSKAENQWRYSISLYQEHSKQESAGQVRLQVLTAASIIAYIRLSSVFLFQQFFTLTFRKFPTPTPVVVEWLTLLLRTQILARRSWLRCFVGFLSSSRQMPEWHKIKPRPLPSTSFPIHHSPINISLDAIQSELLKRRR
jgi:hypothetical protein